MTYLLIGMAGVVVGAVGMVWTIRPAVLDQAWEDGHNAGYGDGWHDRDHAAPYQLHNHR
jgi:hypothetical protein